MILTASFQWKLFSKLIPGLFEIISLTEILATTLITTLIFKYLLYRWQNRRLFDIASKIDGPTPLPILGNALMFLGSPEGKVSPDSCVY